MSVRCMIRNHCWVYVAVGLCSAASAWAADTTSNSPETVAETPAQKAERMKWFVDARFGMFIHWGPVSLKGTEIGWSRGTKVPVDVYDHLYKEFNPVKFDAKQYVSVAKDAGMKYITLVTKHHDGFAMYATQLSDYSIMHAPLRRDVTKELAEECQKQGIHFCTYYSIIDWYHPDYLPRGAGDNRQPQDADFNRYYDFMKGQLREIVENYHPSMIWFDGEWEDHWTVERGRDVYAMLRRLDPKIITNNRLGKDRAFGQGGLTPAEKTVGDFHTPEQETGRFSGDRNVYWESCMTICQQWAWKPNDALKSLKECIDLLVTNAGNDGNLMLNVGPMPSGEIEPRQVERLHQIGQWMKQYGESIYGTRGGPFKPEKWGVCTCKGNSIFVHVLRWPDDGALNLSPIGKKIIASRLLGGGNIEMKQTDAGIAIAVPPHSRQQLDTVIELRLDGSAVDIPPLTDGAGARD